MIMIRGTKLTTPPTPAMMPSTTRDWAKPSGSTLVQKSPSQAKPSSTQPWGYAPTSKVI